MDYKLEPPVDLIEEFSDSYKEMRGFWWDEQLQDWVNEDLERWSDCLEWDYIADGLYL